MYYADNIGSSSRLPPGGKNLEVILTAQRLCSVRLFEGCGRIHPNSGRPMRRRQINLESPSALEHSGCIHEGLEARPPRLPLSVIGSQMPRKLVRETFTPEAPAARAAGAVMRELMLPRAPSVATKAYIDAVLARVSLQRVRGRWTCGSAERAVPAEARRAAHGRPISPRLWRACRS